MVKLHRDEVELSFQGRSVMHLPHADLDFGKPVDDLQISPEEKKILTLLLGKYAQLQSLVRGYENWHSNKLAPPNWESDTGSTQNQYSELRDEVLSEGLHGGGEYWRAIEDLEKIRGMLLAFHAVATSQDGKAIFAKICGVFGNDDSPDDGRMPEIIDAVRRATNTNIDEPGWQVGSCGFQLQRPIKDMDLTRAESAVAELFERKYGEYRNDQNTSISLNLLRGIKYALAEIRKSDDGLHLDIVFQSWLY